MKALSLILAIHAVLRSAGDGIAVGLVSTLMLAVFAAICYLIGGWKSPAGAVAWLRANPLSLALTLFGTGSVAVLGVWGTGHSIAVLVAESIDAYFFFHAVCALGTFVWTWLSRRLRAQ